MNPLILFLVRLATASKTVADATGTYENAAQNGIEKELKKWFRDHVQEISALIDKTDTPTTAEIQLGECVGKLDAIREYKNRTGKSLVDSKRAIENYFSTHYLTFKGH